MSAPDRMVRNMHHHPWREFRERGDDVRLFFTEFEDGRVAATQGNHVYLDRRLLQVGRRCAIQHEQSHRDLGLLGCDDEAVERRVRRHTARRLLSASQLVPVAKWTQSVEEAADELWVTPEVLRDFMASLHPVERLMIETAVRKAHG